MSLFYKKFFLIIDIITSIYIQKYDKTAKENIILKNGRKYLDICLHDLIKQNSFYIKKPKISIIIPVYNCQNSISFSIISIQNQIMSDYEIILINDNSKDNSRKFIENIQKKDSRIILINNKRNMGTLYSRNIGVLASRGKYIFPMDNDDMLFNQKLFGLLNRVGIINNYDIIGYKVIYGFNYNSKVEHMFHEPYIINKNINYDNHQNLKFHSVNNNDIHLWGKSIKSEIYKKVIELMGIKRYSVYLCYGEDNVMTFLLFSYANSYKFLPIYGLFHLNSNNTASFTLSKNHKYFSKIYFLDILYDFTKNNFKEKNYVFSYLSRNINSRKQLDTKNSIYLRKVLNKILNCNYIKKKNKLKILEIFKTYLNH